MRSQHVDRFNHDEDASGYDADVADETDPIRAGYAETLAWVAATACIGPGDTVMDLGSGTGNLTVLLPEARRILCVDISSEMSRIARGKLRQHSEIEWIQADLLEVLESDLPPLDAVVSTYAVHHLTDSEKEELFSRLSRMLSPGGRCVFGDLMFEDDAKRARILSSYRASGRAELADEIEEEFFWNVEHARQALDDSGFATEARRFSGLSWGLAGRLR